MHYKGFYAVQCLKKYVPSSVKTKRQRLTIRHGLHAASKTHCLSTADMLLICLFCNSTRVFYLLFYWSEGSLKVTAAADALRAAGEEKKFGL